MTSIQRLRSDLKTTDRRDKIDNAIMDNREKNDALTSKRRSNVDQHVKKQRADNDELTANRREEKDENKDMAIAISLLLIAMAIGIFFVLI
jgi:hypothetical protein